MNAWTVHGAARIGDRGPFRCVLTVRPDGRWEAEVSTFTIAAGLDLFVVTDEGGELCGPAAVAHSRADSRPLRGSTRMVGCGPLLIAWPGSADTDVIDGDIVPAALESAR